MANKRRGLSLFGRFKMRKLGNHVKPCGCTLFGYEEFNNQEEKYIVEVIIMIIIHTG